MVAVPSLPRAAAAPRDARCRGSAGARLRSRMRCCMPRVVLRAVLLSGSLLGTLGAASVADASSGSAGSGELVASVLLPALLRALGVKAKLKDAVGSESPDAPLYSAQAAACVATASVAPELMANLTKASSWRAFVEGARPWFAC
eukprot:TRINITY_DN16565_c0_g1_i2.p1 TRINITY_DN16565_c0_g1~~TRINITY_DN16565_c0_g1_i2.p1  ORF type:complete len:164 (-),score=36.00 TRINITY_DN16565_c0_g1_i2:247-681(-)